MQAFARGFEEQFRRALQGDDEQARPGRGERGVGVGDFTGQDRTRFARGELGVGNEQSRSDLRRPVS